MIDFKEKYKDLICEDIPLRPTRDPETGAIPQELDLFDLANKITENGFVENYCLSNEDVEQIRKIRKLNKDTLSLIIGEDIPDERPEEYYKVDLYVRDEAGELQLYAHIELPYIINHAELFMVDEEDPRYFMHEGYEKETGGCRYSCMIKPYGEFKGIYRLGLNTPFKIRDINVLLEDKLSLQLK